MADQAQVAGGTVSKAADENGGLMEHRSLSPQTLAAQALGEADPVSGALAPVITMSTNYEQQPDGGYPQGRVYTRADNPTSEHAERLLAALEGGGCACALFGSGMAAATAPRSVVSVNSTSRPQVSANSASHFRTPQYRTRGTTT